MGLTATPAVAIEFDAGVWTDVSAYARLVSARRGRSTETETFGAGTARVVLSNADRRFDPEHATGPYFGKILPRKRIRVGFTYAAVTYWKFYGYIDGWPQAYDGPNDSTVTVRATDAFKVLARAQIPSAWEQAVKALSPSAWYRLGESSGTVMADSSGSSIHGTYEGGATFYSRTGLIENHSDAAIEFSASAMGAAPASALSGVYPFTLVVPFATLESGATEPRYLLDSGGQFTTTGGGVTIWIEVAGSPFAGMLSWAVTDAAGVQRTGGTDFAVDDTEPHLAVVVVTNASTMTLYMDGSTSGTSIALTGEPASAASKPVYVGNNPNFANVDAASVIDDVVIFDGTALTAANVTTLTAAFTAPWSGDRSGARITRLLDYIAWPVGDRNLDTGRATLVAATLETDALTHCQDVERSEGGRFFVDRLGRITLIGRSNFVTEAAYKTSNATFGDSGAELRYKAESGDLFGFDDDGIINEASVRPFGGSEQTYKDDTSADPTTGYGLMTKSETTLESRPELARNRAEYLVNRYKNPLLRIPHVTIKPERSPASLWPILGASDLGFRYTFNRHPQGIGAAISKEFHLEGESFTITPGDATFEWELSPAESAWVWGDPWPIRWSY